jgi:hypothetical protein
VSVDEKGAGHPETDAEPVTGGRRGTGQLEDEELARPARHGERRPHEDALQPSRSALTTDEAGVVDGHGGDRTAKGILGQASIGLYFR